MDFSTTALQVAFFLRTACMGRRKLADEIGLGEMAVRLELDRLRDAGLVQCERAGCRLTDKGHRAFGAMLKIVRQVETVDLAGLRIDAISMAALLSGPTDGPSAWQLRDAVIREGAAGLILLTRRSAEWAFSHDGEPIRAQNEIDANNLEDAFPEALDGDSMLICAAPDRVRCSAGLWGAVRIFSAKP